MSFKFRHLCVEISFPLVALMTAVIIFDTSMSVMICFASVIAHETGHLLAMKHFGSYPQKIKLTLFDIAIIDRKKITRSNKAELVITLAGVTVNFILVTISYFLMNISENSYIQMIFDTNFTLGLFNSLPIDSLDGGQALIILLSMKFSPFTSMKILDIISFVILIPVAVMGFLVLLQSKYNFTLLLTALYLIAIILLKNRKPL